MMSLFCKYERLASITLFIPLILLFSNAARAELFYGDLLVNYASQPVPGNTPILISGYEVATSIVPYSPFAAELFYQRNYYKRTFTSTTSGEREYSYHERIMGTGLRFYFWQLLFLRLNYGWYNLKTGPANERAQSTSTATTTYDHQIGIALGIMAPLSSLLKFTCTAGRNTLTGQKINRTFLGFGFTVSL